VPSTAVLLGRVNWWPSALWRNQPAEELSVTVDPASLPDPTRPSPQPMA